MTRIDPDPRSPSAVEMPSAALSPNARVVGESLGRWRVRIAETQTLARLTLSLLQGETPISESRKAHLGRLTTIELRAVAQLPVPDLSSLRSTTNARESGVGLRGPDTIAAEHYLVSLRDRVSTGLVSLIEVIEGPLERSIALLDGTQLVLDELARAVDLLETMMYPRLHNPPVEVGAAFERALSARAQTIAVSGATEARIHQVRGLMRLLAEIVATLGDRGYAHVTRSERWIEVSVAADATAHGHDALAPARAELLRFAAYLIRAQAEYRDRTWRLAFVACSP